MSGVTYDSGALIAGDKNDRTMWAIHNALLEDDVDVVVPASVIAETWRDGARQASLVRMLQGCEIDHLDDNQAKSVGVALGSSGHDDLTDVHVVVVADRRQHFAIYTSNRSHIERVAAALGWNGNIRDV